jgi:hypothetical protein
VFGKARARQALRYIRGNAAGRLIRTRPGKTGGERLMDDIAALEQRIMAALDRIGSGVDRQMDLASAAATPGPSPEVMAELDHLRGELDEERMANAQLAERLKVQRERAERVALDLKMEVDRLALQVDDQALAMQRLVGSTVRMREDLRRMREAGPKVDAALIDKAMAAELEATEAVRAAEALDLADLVAALAPIVKAEEARAHG